MKIHCIYRLKSEHNYYEKKRQKGAGFIDNAFENKGH